MLKIQIILGSTRDNRHGNVVAGWVLDQAKTRTDFEVEFLDLKGWNLPMYNEPHPAKVQEWKKKIHEGDGYIIVTPEYNHGYSAALKNALDYPYEEWARKAVGFVGYSVGSMGGARSVEQLKQVAVELHLANVPTSVYVSNAWEAFDEKGEVKDPKLNRSLEAFFNDFVWWTTALKEARSQS